MTAKPIAPSQSSTSIYVERAKLPEPPRIHDYKHRRYNSIVDSALMPHFAGRTDVFVGSEGYLCFNVGDHPSARLVPDCVVAFGVSPDAILTDDCYLIDDVGKPPDFVLEIASRSTGRRDYTVKRDGYARFGVGEYWRFDHTGGDFHDAPLAGDTLVNGRYEPIALADDRPGKMFGMLSGYSQALGLYICWDNSRLRFYDPNTDEFLKDATDMHSALDEAQERIRQLEAELELRRSHNGQQENS